MQRIRFRYPFRSLARDPIFTVVVTLVLSLGIAINTTIFSVIEQLVLNPLPYENPDRLVMVWESNPSLGEPAGSRVPAAWSNFAEWHSGNRSFQAIEAFEQTGYNLTGLKSPEHLKAARATGGFFKMLGINAFRGRVFTQQDAEASVDQVVIVTSRFEIAHFSSESALGRKLLLDGTPYTIVGVLPKDFHLPQFFRGAYEYAPDIWVPMPASITLSASKVRKLFVLARLKNSVSAIQAQFEMTAISKRLEQFDPSLNKGYGINLVPLKIENADPDFERALYLLWGAALVLLSLGCANVASLMLVRATSKRKDLAVMQALGAPRSALIGDILIEGSLLVVTATIFAVLGSYAGISWLRSAKPGGLVGAEHIHISLMGLIFAGSVLILCAVIFTMVPAWLNTKLPLNSVLRTSRDKTGGRIGTVVRRTLVCGEIAIALVLTVGATLLARSFERLLDVDPGFSAHNVLTARIALSPARYPTPQARMDFCERILDQAQRIPMVQSASLVDNFPLYSIHYTYFEIEGRQAPQPENRFTADYANITSDFFQTMGTPLQAGRLPNPGDMRQGAEEVVILNASLANKLWPGANPIGSHIRVVIPHQNPEPWRRVIGVVGDFRQFNIDSPPRPEMFWPAREYSQMTLVLKASSDPTNIFQALQRAVSSVDKEQPLSDVQTLQHMVDHSIEQRRFNTLLLSTFAGLGTFLALVGVYGLISYIISSQKREIGIRCALGAQPRHIFLDLIRQILPLAGIGILAGLLIAFISRKLVTNLLFGISSFDPVTYFSLPLIFILLILFACLREIWQVARTQPSAILRHE